MSFVQALRACAVPVRLAAVTALAFGLSSPALAFETRVGVDAVEFSWSEASGNPPYYGVWLTRNGSSFLFHELVEGNRVAVDVEPGDNLAIYVRGMRPRSDGSTDLGPASEVSPTVFILATPRFANAEPGSWVVHCPGCGGTREHDVGDARTESLHLGAPAPWEIVGDARLADGSRWVVWLHPTQNLMGLSSLGSSSARMIGPVGLPYNEFVGAIDIDGDGADEFLFVEPGSGNWLDRYALAGDGTLVWTGSTPGLPGAELGPIADYTGDGRDDLLWHERDTGAVFVWSFTDFQPNLGTWRLRDGYRLGIAPPPSVSAVAAGDYDGDGAIDLIWRGSSGELWISYLTGPSVEVRNVPWLEGDERLEVVGSPEVDGRPGAEIALHDTESGRLWILYPLVTSFPTREPVLDAGVGSQVYYVAP